MLCGVMRRSLRRHFVGKDDICLFVSLISYPQGKMLSATDVGSQTTITRCLPRRMSRAHNNLVLATYKCVVLRSLQFPNTAHLIV